MKINLISLGCDKNRVDSEKMLGLLRAAGFSYTDDEYEILCKDIETGIKEVIVPEVPAQEVVEPKEVTPIVAPAIDATPIVKEPQTLETPVSPAPVELVLPAEVPEVAWT